MAKKPNITNTSAPNSAEAINADLNELADAFDNTLSLDGSTPNAMQADFDLNSNDVLNGGDIYTSRLFINGVQATVSLNGGVAADQVSLEDAGGHYDASEVEAALLELATGPVQISFYHDAIPTTSLVFNTIVFTRPFTMLDDFAGSLGRVKTNPTSEYVITVSKNGSSIGTITISTGGVFTFSTTLGAQSFVAGDYMTWQGQVTADATLAGVSINHVANKA